MNILKHRFAFLSSCLILICFIFAGSRDHTAFCQSGEDLDSSQSCVIDADSWDDNDIKNFAVSNYSRYAIDTTGVEPMIAVRIETNGDFTQLESLGLKTGSEKGSRWGDVLSTSVPIRMIPDIIALESVKRIEYSIRGHLIGQNNKKNLPLPDDGEIAGQITGLDHLENTELWIMFHSDENITNDKAVSNDTNRHFGTLLNQKGRFRITGIPNGLYNAKIVRRYVFDDMKLVTGNSKCDTTLIIIDNIIIKGGCASIIDIIVTPEMSQNMPAGVKWKQRYRP